MPKLLLATTNRGKVREYRSLLSGLPFKLLTPDEFHDAVRQRLLPLNWIYDIGVDAENMEAYVKDPEEATEIRRMAAEYRG